MRYLLLTAIATLIAAPAAAQRSGGDPLDPTVRAEPDRRPAYTMTTGESSDAYAPDPFFVRERPEPVPINKDYRRFDWNKPEPGKGGYFADDYSHGIGLNPATLGKNDRIYRGRDLRYYCRRWNGETQPLDPKSMTLLGDTLDAGGSIKLRDITDPAVAAATESRAIMCGSYVVWPD